MILALALCGCQILGFVVRGWRIRSDYRCGCVPVVTLNEALLDAICGDEIGRPTAKTGVFILTQSTKGRRLMGRERVSLDAVWEVRFVAAML